METKRLSMEEALEIAKINPELEDAVFRNMPPNYSKLEQAFYVYGKLCSILNYDSQFWVSGQTEGPKGPAHSNPESIKNISSTNTDVVCYDFCVILSKFFEKLGINYSFTSESYPSHTELTGRIPFFKDESFMANIVYYFNIFGMKHLKVNKVLDGFGYVHVCKSDGTEFDSIDRGKRDILSAEYTQIAENIINNVQVRVLAEQEEELKRKEKLNFDEQRIRQLEEKVKTLCQDFVNIDGKQSMELFFKQVSMLDMNRFDASYYIGKIFKNIVPQSKNTLYTYSILKERSPDNPELYDMVGMVNICSDTHDYYIKITPPNKVESLTQKEVQKAFDKEDLCYLDRCYLLPNIRHKDLDKEYIHVAKNEYFKKMKSKKICDAIEYVDKNGVDNQIDIRKLIYYKKMPAVERVKLQTKKKTEFAKRLVNRPVNDIAYIKYRITEKIRGK